MTQQHVEAPFASGHSALPDVFDHFGDVEVDAPMFDLPAAGPLGEDGVAGARVSVFGQTRGRDVDQEPVAPDPHVGEVQVSEGDRPLRDALRDPFQLGVGCIGPDVLVVALGVGMDDQQGFARFAFAEPQRKGQRAQPFQPLRAEGLALPSDAALLFFVLEGRREVGDVPVGVAPHAPRVQRGEAFQDLARPRAVHAVIAHAGDRVGAALRAQVVQTCIERAHVAVHVGEERDPHQCPGINRV